MHTLTPARTSKLHKYARCLTSLSPLTQEQKHRLRDGASEAADARWPVFEMHLRSEIKDLLLSCADAAGNPCPDRSNAPLVRAPKGHEI